MSRRLEPELYQGLRIRVLVRDGWMCQYCGARHNLDVHHILHRSHGGGDEEINLITLCRDCHSEQHTPKQGTASGSSRVKHRGTG